ncbi:MAG: hypothetical protein ACD_57C00132G0001 [uncultured bacterium]|nr:MAG: hypothetical protein ACD_57C00132G0001 [uncultured bacterium]
MEKDMQSCHGQWLLFLYVATLQGVASNRMNEIRQLHQEIFLWERYATYSKEMLKERADNG